MRPVNLIPPEDRRGDQAPLRTGPLAYILLGALVLALAGVVALVLTGNQVSERKDDLATLKHEDAVAKAKAARLVAYTQFQTLAEARAQTVRELADSRFDWERVLRELALILPSDVTLSELSASATSDDVAGGSGGGGGGGLRGAVAGPALELSGCASGQAGVAGFVDALKDIDGVTRVGVESSSVADKNESGRGGSEAECAGGAAFSLVVAFDAAPIPAPQGEGEGGAAPESAQKASSETSESGSESAGEGSEGG
jgi:Tfp pilus assembly protein PilN